ncbi:MAG: hypothetical protein IIV19_05025 [Bacteroidaceae bacterium]|nr:hypothetical protein [Bacteroidaceae bacterium]
MKRITLLFTLILLFATNSCDIESSASGYSVYFTCDYGFHPFNQITSFGQFITVKRKNNKSYEVTDANGYKTTTNLTEIELRTPYYYGLGGLIIGTPSMCDGNIWVYDWACPACETARYRLEITHDATGLATCTNCGNIYDLNSGGIPVKGKSRPLWKYNYFTNGTTIVIRN